MTINGTFHREYESSELSRAATHSLLCWLSIYSQGTVTPFQTASLSLVFHSCFSLPVPSVPNHWLGTNLGWVVLEWPKRGIAGERSETWALNALIEFSLVPCKWTTIWDKLSHGKRGLVTCFLEKDPTSLKNLGHWPQPRTYLKCRDRVLLWWLKREWHQQAQWKNTDAQNENPIPRPIFWELRKISHLREQKSALPFAYGIASADWLAPGGVGNLSLSCRG